MSELTQDQYTSNIFRYSQEFYAHKMNSVPVVDFFLICTIYVDIYYISFL